MTPTTPQRATHGERQQRGQVWGQVAQPQAEATRTAYHDLTARRRGRRGWGQGYDDNGNRDCAEGASAYDDQDRLTTCNGVTYSFDENGSLTGRGADTFQYDVLGNLLSATVNGATVDYIVDADGRRVGRTVNGVTTRYVYQDQLRIAAELDNAGNVVSEFLYRDSPNSPELMVRAGVTYRIVTDHLGSPREVVEEVTGDVVFAATYSAWGHRTVTVGSEDFVPFGFAGGLYDVDTGLVRFGARDYEPGTARWTAKDPLSWEGGQENLYAYVGNDPVNRTDPPGLAPDDWGCIAAAAAAAVQCAICTRLPAPRCWAQCAAALGVAAAVCLPDPKGMNCPEPPPGCGLQGHGPGNPCRVICPPIGPPVGPPAPKPPPCEPEIWDTLNP